MTMTLDPMVRTLFALVFVSNVFEPTVVESKGVQLLSIFLCSN